jgi:LmbE family N-acetylglucosaminyl deacetylase
VRYYDRCRWKLEPAEGKDLNLNALAITAHHDDAALWMGGALLRTISLGWHWDVVYMCSEVKWIERQLLVAYFKDFCQQIGVGPYILRFEDYIDGQPFNKNDQSQMESELLNAIAENRYDWVFTHNLTSPSEYWDHANHFEVAQVVKRVIETGMLTAGVRRMVQFSYRMSKDHAGQNREVVARSTATHHLNVTEEELSAKRRWRDSVPDPGNMRVLQFPCPNPEGFEATELPLPFVANSNS